MQAISIQAGFISFDQSRLARKIFSLTLPGIGALALSVAMGSWILYLRPVAPPHFAPTPAIESAPSPAAESAPTVATQPYGGLFDPGPAPGSLAQKFELQAQLESTPLAPSEPESAPPAPDAP